MNISNIGFALALGVATASAARAETASISTEAPQKSVAAPAKTHKPKAVHAAKQQPANADQKTTSAPGTIPMDFSGMARRPIDLKSETNPQPRPENGDASFKPSMGASQNGGFSPGMKIGF